MKLDADVLKKLREIVADEAAQERLANEILRNTVCENWDHFPEDLKQIFLGKKS